MKRIVRIGMLSLLGLLLSFSLCSCDFLMMDERALEETRSMQALWGEDGKVVLWQGETYRKLSRDDVFFSWEYNKANRRWVLLSKGVYADMLYVTEPDVPVLLASRGDIGWFCLNGDRAFLCVRDETYCPEALYQTVSQAQYETYGLRCLDPSTKVDSFCTDVLYILSQEHADLLDRLLSGSKLIYDDLPSLSDSWQNAVVVSSAVLYRCDRQGYVAKDIGYLLILSDPSIGECYAIEKDGNRYMLWPEEIRYFFASIRDDIVWEDSLE